MFILLCNLHIFHVKLLVTVKDSIYTKCIAGAQTKVVWMVLNFGKSPIWVHLTPKIFNG